MKRLILPVILIGFLGILLSCSRGGVKESLGPREQFQKAMAYYDNGDYLKSQAEFQKVVYGFPGQPFVDTAQFYLSMSYYQIESYPEAIGEFKRLLQAYPSSPLADDAQYYVGMSHFNESPGFTKDQTETYAAIDEFGVFLDRFPSSSYAEDVQAKLDILYDKLARKLFKSGQLYLKLNDFEPALIYFEQVRDNYPQTEWAKLALYYTGEAQLKLGRKSDALETFQNFVTAFPDYKLTKKARDQIEKLSPVQAGG
jgi:outer membrane protein assembly factor BamD